MLFSATWWQYAHTYDFIPFLVQTMSLFSKNDLTPFSSNPELRSGKYLTDSKRPLTHYIKLARLDENQKHHLHYLTTSADTLPFDDDFTQKQKKPVCTPVTITHILTVLTV